MATMLEMIAMAAQHCILDLSNGMWCAIASVHVSKHLALHLGFLVLNFVTMFAHLPPGGDAIMACSKAAPSGQCHHDGHSLHDAHSLHDSPHTDVANSRVLLTFAFCAPEQLYKNSQKVSEMTGAKVDKLKSLIAEALA